jgi:hypothetical protein
VSMNDCARSVTSSKKPRRTLPRSRGEVRLHPRPPSQLSGRLDVSRVGGVPLRLLCGTAADHEPTGMYGPALARRHAGHPPAAPRHLRQPTRECRIAGARHPVWPQTRRTPDAGSCVAGETTPTQSAHHHVQPRPPGRGQRAQSAVCGDGRRRTGPGVGGRHLGCTHARRVADPWQCCSTLRRGVLWGGPCNRRSISR